MIPRGDLSRYAHWEKMHAAYDVQEILGIYQRRWTYPERFLLTYYRMPWLAKNLAWSFEDSVELGCGWGSYSLFLHRFGLTKRIWLLDISRSALRATLEVFSHFQLKPFAVQGEIHSLPFADKAFDVSLSGGLYEHFVGGEQEALVSENCRISRRVLCQVPEGTAAYWAYRKAITFWKGKWPFGFEVPLSRLRIKELFSRSGGTVRAWDQHNLASAQWMVWADRHPWMRKWAFRPGLFGLLRHDALVAVETGALPPVRKRR
jgi:hypothetical protein